MKHKLDIAERKIDHMEIAKNSGTGFGSDTG